MGLIKASDVKSFAMYEREVGIDNNLPVGKHNFKVERAEVRVDEKSGQPVLFVLERIKGGDADDRTNPASFRWFVSEVDQDGNQKSDEQIKRGESFLRQMTMGFLKATLGKDIAQWPDSITGVPGKDAEVADIKEFFTMAADAVKGRGATVTISTRMGKDAEGNKVATDQQNFAYSAEEEQTAFKL